MAKKCIPGVICIENMTLFLIFGLLIVIFFLVHKSINNTSRNNNGGLDKPTFVMAPGLQVGLDTRNSPSVILDPYGPPLRNDGAYFPRDSADLRGQIRQQGQQEIVISAQGLPQEAIVYSQPRGIPINVQTRGTGGDYTQMGILTRANAPIQGPNGDMILTLMGRKLMVGLDKWQYYTISNTGNMNTKLPISLNGRSCSGEYGCDIVQNGDILYVEGYNDTFRATIYENSRFNYIPYI